MFPFVATSDWVITRISSNRLLKIPYIIPRQLYRQGVISKVNY